MTPLAETTIAAILTLMVFSYLVRDNPLYQIASHLLVAVGVAYAVVVAIHGVLWPRLLQPLAQGGSGRLPLLIPLLLSLMLLARAVPRGRPFGRPALAYLTGVGLALAVGGALLGTLIPQVDASMISLLPGEGGSLMGVANQLLVVIGTILILLSFLYYRGPPTPPGEVAPVPDRLISVQRVGRGLLMLVLGALFGSLTVTYLTLLIGRWDFLLNDWLRPLLGL